MSLPLSYSTTRRSSAPGPDRWLRRSDAAEHGFDAAGFEMIPETFDPPACLGTLTAPERRLVRRAWMLEDAPLGVMLTGAAYHDNPLLYADCTACRLAGYMLAELWGDLANTEVLVGPCDEP